MNVWAFNKPADLRQVQLLYEASYILTAATMLCATGVA